MEVELDLWSSRSTDEVDHILSDVDCCDVPDVDEFILSCSSSVSCDLTKNDLTSSVDMHLNHHLNNHNSNNNNPLSHLMDETGVPGIHSHLQGHHHARQSASPSDTTADDCCDDLSSHHATSLTSLVEHLNDASPHQQQLHLHQHQQQQLHQHHHHHQQLQSRRQDIEFGSHPLSGPQNGLHFQQQPSIQIGLNPVRNNFQQQVNTNTGSGPQLNTSSPVYSAGVDGVVVNQQQERLLNDSLIASRVDHSYILNDTNNCQQQFDAAATSSPSSSSPISASSSANQNQDGQCSVASSFAGNNRRFVTSSGGAVSSTTSSGAQLAPGQLVDQHQLQLLLNSQPQAICCQPSTDTGGVEPLLAAATKPSSGQKRRQTSAAGNKRTKKGASATAGSNEIEHTDTTGASCGQAATKSPNPTVKTNKAARNPVSSSSRCAKGAVGAGNKVANASDANQPISTTRLDEASAGGSKARATARRRNTNKQQAAQISSGSLSGQVSPTLSSSGVSSLSSCSSSSSSSSSNSELADNQQELCEQRLSLKLEPLISGASFDEASKGGKARRTAGSRCQSPSQSSPTVRNNRRGAKASSQISSSSSAGSQGAAASRGPSRVGTPVKVKVEPGEQVDSEQQEPAREQQQQRPQQERGKVSVNEREQATGLRLQLSPNNNSTEAANTKGEITNDKSGELLLEKLAHTGSRTSTNTDQQRSAQNGTQRQLVVELSTTSGQPSEPASEGLQFQHQHQQLQQPQISLSKLLGQTPQTPNSGSQQQQANSSQQSPSVVRQLFGANLSASSRQKLSSLSSCLIISPTQAPPSLAKTQSGQINNNGVTQTIMTSATCSSSSSNSGTANSSTLPSSSSVCRLGTGGNGGLAPPVPSSASSSGFELAGKPTGQSSVSSSSSATLSPPTSSPNGPGTSSAGCSLTPTTTGSSVMTSQAASTTSTSSPTTSSSLSSSLPSSSSSSTSSSSSSSSSSSTSSASPSPTMQLGCAASSPAGTPSLPTMALISNQDWKSAQTGQVVLLTDEERRTLIAEGYPIPQRFPLSKAEERSLKKIRRKIKNKISAQESRRKKKEYMEELEKKVHLMELKIVELERENRLFKERLTSANQAAGAQQVAAASSPAPSSQVSPVDKLDRAASHSYVASIDEPDQQVPIENATCLSHEPRVAVKLEQEVDQSKIDNGAPGELMRTGGSSVGGHSVREQDQRATFAKSLELTSGDFRTDTTQMQPTQSTTPTTSINVLSSDQNLRQAFVRRKDSTTSVINHSGQQQTSTDDDYFIDDILMSQERQEGQQLAADDDEVDLVANLVGVVCEPDDIAADIVNSIDGLQTTNGRRNSGLTMIQNNDSSSMQASLNGIKVEQRLVGEPVQSS